VRFNSQQVNRNSDSLTGWCLSAESAENPKPSSRHKRQAIVILRSVVGDEGSP